MVGVNISGGDIAGELLAHILLVHGIEYSKRKIFEVLGVCNNSSRTSLLRGTNFLSFWYTY